MRKLLNTLYVTTEDAYLSLQGENIVVSVNKKEIGRFPLHGLQSIVSFSYSGASPALMGICAEKGINLSFCNPNGRFLARCVGLSNGNVYLRREQYRIADDELRSILIAKNMIFGKVYNSRWSLERTIRDHALRVDIDKMNDSSTFLKTNLKNIFDSKELDELRGFEGVCASEYFSCFDMMILRDKDAFNYTRRNRRPPLDRVNALLSFAYSLLTNDCTSALESVGLDSYVGFMHVDRPGRKSLSLDMVEELRPCIADRFVITAINNRIVTVDDFETTESGAVFINDKGRKSFLKKWQEKKREQIMHPYLKERIPWGLVPYVQAQLLSRYIRGDIDEYPPFLWK